MKDFRFAAIENDDFCMPVHRWGPLYAQLVHILFAFFLHTFQQCFSLAVYKAKKAIDHEHERMIMIMKEGIFAQLPVYTHTKVLLIPQKFRESGSQTAGNKKKSQCPVLSIIHQQKHVFSCTHPLSFTVVDSIDSLVASDDNFPERSSPQYLSHSPQSSRPATLSTNKLISMPVCFSTLWHTITMYKERNVIPMIRCFTTFLTVGVGG
jgi:hypothetical protein